MYVLGKSGLRITDLRLWTTNFFIYFSRKTNFQPMGRNNIYSKSKLMLRGEFEGSTTCDSSF